MARVEHATRDRRRPRGPRRVRTDPLPRDLPRLQQAVGEQRGGPLVGVRSADDRVGVQAIALRGLADERHGDLLRHLGAPHRPAADQQRAPHLRVTEVDPRPLDRHIDRGQRQPPTRRRRVAEPHRHARRPGRTPHRRPRPSRCAAGPAGTARRGPRTGPARRSGRAWRARRRGPRPRRGRRRARRAGRRRGPAARPPTPPRRPSCGPAAPPPGPPPAPTPAAAR